MQFKTWFKDNVMSVLPMKMWLRIDYYHHFHRRLDLKAPKTFNEKLCWLKANYHDSSRSKLVDKYLVREEIEKLIGKEYLIPLVGGPWYSFEEIDFNMLPNQFVLKPNHASGCVFICKDKRKIDMKTLKDTVNEWLSFNYYKQGREWEYKFVKPCIIAEKYMVDESGTELKDYKFFCFDGEPRIMFVGSNRGEDTRFDFYDMDFNHLPIINGHKNADIRIEKPKNFNEMIELSKRLSKNMPHVRVDFYSVNGKAYFGELTFYHFGAAVPFEPESWDKQLGDWLTLPEKRRK